MEDFSSAVRLPSREESIAPVPIFDGQGSVVRVVPAAEFRRLHPSSLDSRHARMAGRRERRRAELPKAGPKDLRGEPWRARPACPRGLHRPPVRRADRVARPHTHDLGQRGWLPILAERPTLCSPRAVHRPLNSEADANTTNHREDVTMSRAILGRPVMLLAVPLLVLSGLATIRRREADNTRRM